MMLRAVIVAAALAVAALALSRHHDATRCRDALDATFAVAPGKADAEVPHSVVSGTSYLVAARVIAHCRGGEDLANAAVVLAPRAPAAARRLATEATAREPDNARAWTGAALALRATDAAAAARAQRRAHALNPYAPVVTGP